MSVDKIESVDLSKAKIDALKHENAYLLRQLDQMGHEREYLKRMISMLEAQKCELLKQLINIELSKPVQIIIKNGRMDYE